MKLVMVIPVMAVVFFAISAYREIPDSPQQRTDQITAFQESETISGAAASTVKEELKPSAKTTAKIPASTSNNNEIAPPPPPPPPEEKKIIPMTEDEEAPFVVVEEMPMFPGGDAELLKYIGQNTQYPEAAKAYNIQGRVIIRFCVTAKGGVSQISVLKGVSPELDAEAVRVVSTLPEFRPGKQSGKAVPVWYMVPITFTLK
jgi:protein TonB